MLVGIDLGTTFSAIATVGSDGKAHIITNRDGERTTPSVVMFEDGNIVVGDTAKENSVANPGGVCQFVKRQMGDKKFSFRPSRNEKYSAEEISAMILKRLKEDAEDATGNTVDGAVITVPAYFDDAQRNATKDAGEIAGLNVLHIINEPTAAAVAYCYGETSQDCRVMVFDLGGGTFDITIMELSNNLTNIRILSTTGNRSLGGFDFDNLIINKAMEEYREQFGMELDDDDEAAQELRLRAENVKKSLSNRNKAPLTIRANGKTLKMEITREDFDKMMQRHLRTMKGYMADALAEANLTWEDISKVLLVGGSSRIPCVQEMIRNTTGIEPSKELNPDEAVALGASYYAEFLLSKVTGRKNCTSKDVEVVDVCSHGLGTIATDPETDEEHVTFIIQKNTRLPAQKVDVFATAQDNQEEIRLRLVEGDDPDPDYCTIIYDELVSIPKAPKETPVVIAMRYGLDGIVHAAVYIIPSGDPEGEWVEVATPDIERKSNLTREQVQRKKRAMDSMSID